MITTRVSSRGRVVIPAEVRRKLGIGKGTPLVVSEHEGAILLRPATREDFDGLAGILPRKPSLARKSVREHARERVKEGR